MMPAVSGMGSINFASPLHLTRTGSGATGQDKTPKVDPAEKGGRQSVDTSVARTTPVAAKTVDKTPANPDISDALASRLLFSADELPKENGPRRSAIEQIFAAEKPGSTDAPEIAPPPSNASNRFIETLKAVRSAEQRAAAEGGQPTDAVDRMKTFAQTSESNDPSNPKQVGRMDKTA